MINRRLNYRLSALIVHQRMPANTDRLRSLPDSQPGAKPEHFQTLTVSKRTHITSAQQGILRLLSPDHFHRAAPECVIQLYGNMWQCFRRWHIDNQIKMHFRKIKRQQSEVYINEPLETDSEGNTLTIADILASNVNIEEETELRINSQKLYRYIDEELDEREKEIICKRYGIRDGRGFVCEAMTQREIAKQLKISRSYISRIEKKALEKLRRRFEQG